MTEEQFNNLEEWANSVFGVEWISKLLTENRLRGDVFYRDYMDLLNSHKTLQQQNKQLIEALESADYYLGREAYLPAEDVIKATLQQIQGKDEGE